MVFNDVNLMLAWFGFLGLMLLSRVPLALGTARAGLRRHRVGVTVPGHRSG